MDAASHVAELERQCEQRVREARAAGLLEGEAAGRNRAVAEVQPVVQRLGRAIEELSGLRARFRKQAEADTLKLALAIARRILRRELVVDPEALAGLLVASLEKLQAQEILRIRIHPSHATLLNSCLRNSASAAAIEVIADAASLPGDVVFETERGNLDASVESQLQEIERGLADRLRRQP
jgi:flagellar assembly protein FliH